jgi:ribonuclease HII
LKICEIKKLLNSETDISEELVKQLLTDERVSVQRMYEKYLKRKEKEKNELERLAKLYKIESSPRFFGQKVAGIDEAGRGPLAGPVYAAAVILPPGKYIAKLNDSKKVAPKVRESLAEEIKVCAVAWAIGTASVAEIEELNILHASHLAMTRALDVLQVEVDHVLVDGKMCPDFNKPVTAIVDGDEKCACIAAASILAKTERDKFMLRLAEKYPQYGFDKHKGYATAEHYEAIRKYGITPAHRPSFLKKELGLA